MDFVCSDNTIDGAFKILTDSDRKYEWYQIVDIDSGEVVRSTHRPYREPIKVKKEKRK